MGALDIISRIISTERIDHDFFISYSRADGSVYAAALSDQLQNNGLSAFLDLPDAVGQGLPYYLKKALSHSRFVILIASDRAVESSFIREEIARARDQRKPIIIIDIDGAYAASELSRSYGFSYFTESSNALQTGLITARVIETIEQVRDLKKALPISWPSRLINFFRTIFQREKKEPGIFISYRTEDSAGYALWLYEVMRIEFRSRQVFIDIAQIETGSNFDEAIKCALAKCKVLTALIGRRWLLATDSQGNSRLNDPKDYVYLEVLTALVNQLRLLPVLLDGATMPREEELPSAISRLSYLKPVDIRPRYATEDVKALLRAIRKDLKN